MGNSPPRFRAQLLGLAAFALLVRVGGLNWDEGHFFHPDERRIAMAVGELSLRPLQWNPHFFAYGSFPFYLVKLVTAALAHLSAWFSSYDGAIYTGRALATLWGVAAVVLLAVLGRRLYGARVGLLAGGLLAATVLHVQNSRFATNDAPLACLVLLALLGMVEIAERGKTRDFVLAGAATGLALATKFSALPLLLPLALAAFFHVRAGARSARMMRGLALALGCTVLAFAAGEPYAILDSRAYLHDVLEQSAMVRHAGLLPYTTQYIGVPKLVYDLREMLLWGMGPLLGLAAIAGTLALLAKRRRVEPREWVLLAWVLPSLAATFWFEVKFLRYLLPVYPLLILWGAVVLERWAGRSRWGRLARAGVIATTACYLAAFLAIGARPYTEVAASRWFYAHVPAGSRVLVPHWDEGFPLQLPGLSPTRYTIKEVPYYEPDTSAKITALAHDLASSEIVVFQTKRLYGAITRAPARYPLTNNYFFLLFSGDLGYTLVNEEASRPGLLGVELPDELADESFSVYDHPKVVIFRNTGHLTAGVIEAQILRRLPSHPLTRTDLLLAHPGAVSSAAVELTTSSLAATVLCAALLELLGLAALPLLRAALPARPGMAALAKVVGVLLFAWLPWIATSIGWLPFTQPTLLASTALLVAAGLAVRRRWPRRPLPRTELVVTEVAFWATFAVFLGLRLANPAIYWGEKPMDFSFLNVLYRTATLPPPEPWLAGSALNYTYFGHFVVAAIGKALGIHPALMFNLGIPAVAALTAVAALAAGWVLGRSWRTGVAAVCLTVFVGNLSGARELIARHVINFDYFWATSRVVPDTINEFPFWSFVFADLHAHVMAMPWAVALSCILFVWLGRSAQPRPARPGLAAIGMVTLAALLLGATAVTNGWSMPTYTGLLVALLAAHWLAHREGASFGRLLRTGVTRVLLPAAVVLAGAIAAYAPFWLRFSPPTRQWGWELGPYARPTDYLNIFGAFIVLLVPLLFAAWSAGLAGRSRWSKGQRAAVFVVAALLAATLLNWSTLASRGFQPANSVCAFALALAAVGACLAVSSRTPEAVRIPAALAAFAFGLTAVCEVVFVWDRMNTVFKFYLDAWLLLAPAAAVAWSEVWRRRSTLRVGVVVWRVVAGAAVAIGLLTSVTGAVGSLRPRHVDGPSWTLDGMAYLAHHASEDGAAMAWLNREIHGVPVLCEAVGPSYQEFGRVSMNTGLPAVLGWDYHVFQRGHPWSAINQRKADVQTIYTSAQESQVAAALQRYRVALLYVGPIERSAYGGGNLANFERWTDLLTPVYRNPGVMIFGVNSTFSGGGPVAVESVTAIPEPTEAPASPLLGSQDPPGRLRQPRGIATDAAGNVYVCDFGNDRIQEFDRDLKPLAAWGRQGNGRGEFDDPCGVAVAPDGTVYVADTWNNRVQAFDAKGRFLRAWSAGFYGPRGIAVDAAGAVFITDTGNHRVLRFSAQGDKEIEWGGRGSAPGQFIEPIGVAAGSSGLVVCDNGNARVQVFTRDGGFLREFGVPGWQVAAYSEPSVALNPGGTIWVTVPLANEVRGYSTAGALLRTFRRDASAPDLDRPFGVLLRSDGGALLVSTLGGRLLTQTLR
ncbi:MAG: DUF2298 domain-containing protein [Thermoanaerobaculales bacterium]